MADIMLRTLPYETVTIMYRYEADAAEEILKANNIEYKVWRADESSRLENIYMCHNFQDQDYGYYRFLYDVALVRRRRCVR